MDLAGSIDTFPGTLFSISVFGVPAILTGKSNASLQVSQWHSMFSVGKQVGPALALLSTVNYLYAAWIQHDSENNPRIWKNFVGAAVATMGIIPYVPTALA